MLRNQKGCAELAVIGGTSFVLWIMTMTHTGKVMDELETEVRNLEPQPVIQYWDRETASKYYTDGLK